MTTYHFTEKILEEFITSTNARIKSCRTLTSEFNKLIDKRENEKQDLIVEIETLWQKGFIRGSITYRDEVYLEINRPITRGLKHKTIYFGPDENLDKKLNAHTKRIYVGKNPDLVKSYLEMLNRYSDIDVLLRKLNTIQSTLGWAQSGLQDAKSWL